MLGLFELGGVVRRSRYLRVASSPSALPSPKIPAPKKSGFTLLEVILALLIAVGIMAVSIPSITSALNGSRAQKAFEGLDAMVQEARNHSREEGRNYVIVWGRDRVIRMRPEAPANREESEGIQRRNITRNDQWTLHLPAALTPRGTEPDAIWTFWASGVCEPARVDYKGGEGVWSATYNPFTAQAEVRYE
ncbi:MAG: Tfp pilus assembly protein FimT/FimU [Chthoniobacteraceae bacterium]